MKLLRERGADELAVNEKGQNALHLTVIARRLDVVRWLLTSHSSTTEFQMQVEQHQGAHKAISRSSLIPNQAIREASDREGSKPLHTAAFLGSLDMVSILLDNGADVEAKNNIGGGPLHVAFNSAKCAEIAQALLSKGANPSLADAQGMTPLHCAASSGNVDMILILLRAGALRSTYNRLGNLPIHTAARKGHVAAVEALTVKSVDLEAKTYAGDTLLHVSVLTSQLRVAEHLLKNKVDANPWSRSAPSRLDKYGHVVFSKIATKKARRASTQSTTPLHCACFAGDYEMAFLLLDHAALINAATADGKSPLMLAVESDNTDLVYLLLAQGAKVDTKLPESLVTVMHVAFEKGNLETLRVLYQYGASIDARTSDFNVPSECASQCKDTVKRQAVLEWYQGVRKNRAAQARELTARNKQRDQLQNPPQVQQQNQQPNHPQYVLSPQYQLSQQSQMVLVQQPNPAYNQFDPAYDTFPEAPPPYVAGPSAPQRMARRDPVYRPPQ